MAMLVAAAATARADTVRILDDDAQAIQARVDLLQRARQSIVMSCFAIGDDEVALAQLALLRDAALRGVQVRVLVDALHNGIPMDVRAHLLSAGIELREFHPLRIDRPWWTLCRLHDKLLIVDGQEMLTGGRNAEARYFGFAEENFRDRDVYARGEVARTASRYFDALWQSDEVAAGSGPVPSGGSSRASAKIMRGAPPRRGAPLLGSRSPSISPHAQAQRSLDAALTELATHRGVRLNTYGDWSNGRHHVAGVRFLCDQGGEKDREDGVGNELVKLVAGAQRSVDIETPYLVLSPSFQQAIAEARARGVRIRIVTNSLRSTNSLLAQAGYESQKEMMTAMGVELWEFEGPECLHCKSFLIDDRTSVVGSFNLDPRSEHRDTQVAIVVDDPQVAAELRHEMNRNLARSARAAAGSPMAGESADRRLLYGLSRLLAPLFEGEL